MIDKPQRLLFGTALICVNTANAMRPKSVAIPVALDLVLLSLHATKAGGN